MATLKSLLTTKSILAVSGKETNLETGRIWGYSPQNHSGFNTGARWFGCQITSDASKTFTVQVELWGPGGRGSGCSCCCNHGVGGNPGSYIKMNVNMTKCGWICTTGLLACRSGSHCMCGGPGCAACMRVCSAMAAGCCSCACAQGGCGGRNMCTDGSVSHYCCLGTNGACISQVNFAGEAVGSGCGIVCNYGNGNNWPTDAGLPAAYFTNDAGTNISLVTRCNSKASQVAKTFFGHCNMCCWNFHRQQIHTPAMRYSTEGGMVELEHGFMDGYTYSGDTFSSMEMSMNGLSRSPSKGSRSHRCWNGDNFCTCYESTGCIPFWPVAMPSPSIPSCSGVRTHGTSAGDGAIRITYKGDIDVYPD